MAKANYYGGNPEAVLGAPVDIVAALLDYEGFIGDYQDEYIALNPPRNKGF